MSDFLGTFTMLNLFEKNLQILELQNSLSNKTSEMKEMQETLRGATKEQTSTQLDLQNVTTQLEDCRLQLQLQCTLSLAVSTQLESLQKTFMSYKIKAQTVLRYVKGHADSLEPLQVRVKELEQKNTALEVQLEAMQIEKQTLVASMETRTCVTSALQ